MLVLALALAVPALAAGQVATAPARKAAAVPYGSNPAAGQTFVHDGLALYYEVYGQGEPLLIVHGNGGSIGTLAAQIAFFHYALSRDRDGQPRSGQVG